MNPHSTKRKKKQMSRRYEISVHAPHPSMENQIPPAFYKASQENIDHIFEAGATQVGLYCVINNNRRFVKYFYERCLVTDLKKSVRAQDRRAKF